MAGNSPKQVPTLRGIKARSVINEKGARAGISIVNAHAGDGARARFPTKGANSNHRRANERLTKPLPILRKRALPSVKSGISGTAATHGRGKSYAMPLTDRRRYRICK
jgi:hypothetical protein